MAIICPTVTAYTSAELSDQSRLVSDMASRIHIDVADRTFTPVETASYDRFLWDKALEVDVHVMSKDVLNQLRQFDYRYISTIMWHVEIADNHDELIDTIHSKGKKAGLAILQDTDPSMISAFLPKLDHVLVFSGSLGRHGGEADLSLLSKVSQIREISPDIEIGWDGGVSIHNARNIADAGIDVLNVGGAIHSANVPKNAFRQLQSIVSNV